MRMASGGARCPRTARRARRRDARAWLHPGSEGAWLDDEHVAVELVEDALRRVADEKARQARAGHRSHDHDPPMGIGNRRAQLSRYVPQVNVAAGARNTRRIREL